MKKKSSKADLESKRPYFFKIGLIIACSLVWCAFEWETAYASVPFDRPLTEEVDPFDEDEVLKVLRFKKEIPKPPVPKKKAIEKIISATIIEVSDLKIVETETDDFTLEDEDTDLIEIEGPDEPTEDITIMGLVQFKPQFPGCEDAGSEDERFVCFQQSIMNHIKRNFKYPSIAKQLGKEGKVYVKFVIDKQGVVTNISIDRSVDRYLGKEAERLIGTLPKMIPARQYNKPVAVEYVVPINFRLN